MSDNGISSTRPSQGKSTTYDKNARPADWNGVDGATAFRLIELNARSWDETGQMMDEWAATRVKAAIASREDEEADSLLLAFEHGKEMARAQDAEAAASAQTFSEQQVREHQVREEWQWTPDASTRHMFTSPGSKP